jgi:hypothetical protein
VFVTSHAAPLATGWNDQLPDGDFHPTEETHLGTAHRKLGKAYGPHFKVSLGSGRELTFWELAEDLANRMIRVFTRDAQGRRPVFGDAAKFQNDPHWRDFILFYEYFHGDNGAGLGASHQTGWTALVASLIDEWRR